MSRKPTYHAWFSQNQMNDMTRGDHEPWNVPIATFRTTDGKVVRATCTTPDISRSTGPEYNDMVYLGVVTGDCGSCGSG